MKKLAVFLSALALTACSASSNEPTAAQANPGAGTLQQSETVSLAFSVEKFNTWLTDAEVQVKAAVKQKEEKKQAQEAEAKAAEEKANAEKAAQEAAEQAKAEEAKKKEKSKDEKSDKKDKSKGDKDKSKDKNKDGKHGDVQYSTFVYQAASATSADVCNQLNELRTQFALNVLTCRDDSDALKADKDAGRADRSINFAHAKWKQTLYSTSDSASASTLTVGCVLKKWTETRTVDGAQVVEDKFDHYCRASAA